MIPMSDVLDAIWRDMEDKVFVSRADFDEAMLGWKIIPCEIDGVLAGAAMIQGPEYHFSTFKTGKSFTLATVSAQLRPILDEYGYVLVKTPKDDTRQQRFNRRAGFVQYAEDEFFIHMRLDADRWRH